MLHLTSNVTSSDNEKERGTECEAPRAGLSGSCIVARALSGSINDLLRAGTDPVPTAAALVARTTGRVPVPRSLPNRKVIRRINDHVSL